MAITTDTTVNVGTNTDFIIGLSKLIGQYSADEIFNYQYCSSQWRFYQHIGAVTYNDYAPGGEGEPYNLDFPLKWVARYEMDGALDYDPGEIVYNQPGGIYAKIIWLYGTTTPITSLFPNNKRSIVSGDNVYIITSMDMTKCRLHCKDVVTGDYVHPIGPNEQTNYANFDDFKIIETVGGVTSYNPPSHGVIFPAIMFKWNNKLHIHRLFQGMYPALDWSWYLSTNTEDKQVQGYEWDAQSLSFDGTQGVYFPINIFRQFIRLHPSTVENHESWTVDFSGDVGAIYQWAYGHTGGRINPATQDTYLEAMSWYGMMFEHKGVQYKPVIQNGYVTGYTDDMSLESDIDTWTGGTNHEVPPAPPGPSGSDADNMDPISFVAAPFASGLAHYYITTAGSLVLQHISEAMGTWDINTSKKDLYRNLISCKLIKPPTAIPAQNGVFEIYGVKPQYQGSDITISVVTGNPSITFGPYKIPRKFNDFRDFAPYTKAEIYLPYCGWCPLPSHVIGRSVKVHYYTDIIAATCKAVVVCNNNIVAEAAGVCGLDIPFASENVGAKMAAVNSALLATTAGGVQLAAGIGSMVSTKSSAGLKGAASGLSQYISGYSQMAMAFNENWTEISGKNGDGCCLSGATNIIIKVTRPKYGTASTPPYVPAGYAHNVGYVSNKGITVGEASGLLVCDNADTSGISGATDAERAEIKRVLETGIYVNSPPE